jgi:hypothetical protein
MLRPRSAGQETHRSYAAYGKARSLIHLYFFVRISSDGAIDGRSLRSIDTRVSFHPTERVIKPLSLPCDKTTGARSSG